MHGTDHTRQRAHCLATKYYDGYLDQYAEIDHTLTMKEFLKSAFTKLFEMEAQAMELYEKAAGGDMKSLEMAAR